MAVLTTASGLIGSRVQANPLGWLASQIPATVAWGWAGYSLICALFSYRG